MTEAPTRRAGHTDIQDESVGKFDSWLIYTRGRVVRKLLILGSREVSPTESRRWRGFRNLMGH